MKKRRHPDWLKTPMGGGKTYAMVRKQLRCAHVHTICEEAKCPNIGDCFNRGTATFLILGDICTRNCSYCTVTHGKPAPVVDDEPVRIAESVKKLGLNYAIITSVTRDDLADGGADQFYKTVTMIKKLQPQCKVEVLIPDFNGDITALKTVLRTQPTVLNHNIEVASSLFSTMRPQGNYDQSITILKQSKQINKNIPTKSGFMIGLGETKEEIVSLMDDLRQVEVDFLTIGQYLQPTTQHASVKNYYSPEQFRFFKQEALKKGFTHVESGPLVRSSYHAESFLQLKIL
ncbi:MAG: lipoyl synthase [Candidatus Thermoplasmatota archaeon]|nr:lipoyl synthase [Candidatus Thermoplasmatota archaeon]